MKIGIVVGEASGDLLGASLMKALKEIHPDVTFVGMGGPAMIAEGLDSLFEMERLSVMGLIEPLFHLCDLFKIRNSLYHYFLSQKPDVVIGIDSPDFNLGLELKLRQAGIRTIHYVSPSVWAWRKKRVFKIKKAVDLILTLFPFEAKFYEAHQVPVKFVGHPLADMIPLVPDKKAARYALGLNSEETYIALLPGSRRQEIRKLVPVFLESAKLCWQKKSSIKFITSSVNAARDKEFKEIFQEIAPELPLTFFVKRTQEVISAADVVLVTSGTATLEVMLYKRPMVIAYRMANLTYQLAKWLVKLSFIGLPNLLAGECLVPEFIQHDVNAEKISEALLDYLDHPEKAGVLVEKFSKLHQELKQDASRQAAVAVMKLSERSLNSPSSTCGGRG